MQEVEKCRVVQRGVRATGCKGMSDPIHIRRGAVQTFGNQRGKASVRKGIS